MRVLQGVANEIKVPKAPGFVDTEAHADDLGSIVGSKIKAFDDIDIGPGCRCDRHDATASSDACKAGAIVHTCGHDSCTRCTVVAGRATVGGIRCGVPGLRVQKQVGMIELHTLVDDRNGDVGRAANDLPATRHTGAMQSPLVSKHGVVRVVFRCRWRAVDCVAGWRDEWNGLETYLVRTA